MEKYMGNVTFGEYCSALFGQYNNNIKNITYESTDIFIKLTKEPTFEFRRTREISPGKFYFICYNYNGLPIWCPIFVIDERYSTETRKRIIYSINLDYLDHRYKIMFFNLIYMRFNDILKENKKLNDNKVLSTDEKPFPVNFETIYKLLEKNGGKHYSITAYDYMKINGFKKGQPHIYCLSSIITPRFMFINTSLINSKTIHNIIIKESDIDKRRKLLQLLEEMDNIIKTYEDNIEEYHKRIKALEKKYKGIGLVETETEF
jgi:hypothetical protein